MLLQKNDGTYLCGPLDIVCILHDVETDRFHAAFFEEKPFPGPVEDVEKTTVVRLKSKMHHTKGADSIDEAMIHLNELVQQFNVPKENVWKDIVPWDGEIGIVWVVPNWLRGV